MTRKCVISRSRCRVCGFIRRARALESQCLVSFFGGSARGRGQDRPSPKKGTRHAPSRRRSNAITHIEFRNVARPSPRRPLWTQRLGRVVQPPRGTRRASSRRRGPLYAAAPTCRFSRGSSQKLISASHPGGGQRTTPRQHDGVTTCCFGFDSQNMGYFWEAYAGFLQ